MTFFNILFLNLLLTSNLAIHFFPKNAYLIPLLLGLIAIFLYLLLPKLKQNFQNSFMKSNLRVILLFYLYFSTLLLLYVSFQIFSHFFYFITPTYLLIIVMMFFLFITKISFKPLFSLLIIHYVVIFLLMLIILANFSHKDFYLLDFSFSFSKPYLILGLISLSLDNILLIFVPTKKTINKFNFIIGIFLGSLFSCWFILDNYTFVNFKFFYDLDFPSLYRYKIYIGPKYIEHLDNFLNLFLSFYIFLKALFNMELFRIYSLKKNNYIFRFILFTSFALILIILYYMIPFKISYCFIPVVILSLVLVFLMFSLWRFKNDEIK